jgi:hypothetical protein
MLGKALHCCLLILDDCTFYVAVSVGSRTKMCRNNFYYPNSRVKKLSLLVQNKNYNLELRCRHREREREREFEREKDTETNTLPRLPTRTSPQTHSSTPHYSLHPQSQ